MEELKTASELPLVSSIIVTHNCADELATCLEALLESGRGISMEVFVVDNASRDGTVEMVRKRFPSVNLICNSENVFFARANNQGLTRARGKYVFIINPDVFVQKDTLSAMIDFMEANPPAGAASCTFVGNDGRVIPPCWQFRTPTWAITSREPIVRLLGNSKTLGQVRVDNWNGLSAREVDVVSDAFLVARNGALKQIGFYDESFLLYFTEDDLCRRLKNAGFGVFWNAATRICHLSARSTRKKPIQAILKIQRNDLVRYFRKHHGVGAAVMVWVAATFELLTWRLYLIVEPEATDADETKACE